MTKDMPFDTKPIIKNIVATGRFSKPIDIVKAYEIINFEESEYEPETYPALLVKVLINGQKRHVTLYKNGKFIITGAQSEKELNQIYSEIIRILKESDFL